MLAKDLFLHVSDSVLIQLWQQVFIVFFLVLFRPFISKLENQK